MDGVAVPPATSVQDRHWSRPGQEDLTPAECIELLTHRCFVRTTKSDKDRWPFDDRYTEADATNPA